MKTKQEMIFEAALQMYMYAKSQHISMSKIDCIDDAFYMFDLIDGRIKNEQNEGLNSLENKLDRG